MLSDKEKTAIKEVKHFKELTRYWQEEEYEEKEIAGYITTVLNIIEKQSKEIEELNLENIELKQSKIVDKNSIPNQDNFYDCYNYISKEEAKQKEKQAYIDGTNAADKLCNEKWEAKIKAKIEEIDKEIITGTKKTDIIRKAIIYELQSLLEKE